MKKDITYIDAAKFEQVLIDLGMDYFPQAGYVKVLGPKGRAVYVARTKKVGKVTISGFTVEFGAVDLGGEKFGSVEQILDFAHPEETVLANFEALLRVMKELPPVEPKRKPSPLAGASSPKPQGWSEKAKTLKELSGEEKAKRMALIAKVAAEKGAEISAKTEAELGDDEATDEAAMDEAELEELTAPEA